MARVCKEPTYNWMSPEQALHDARKTYTLCDMFSFGLIVKWLLVGIKSDVPFRDFPMDKIIDEHKRLHSGVGSVHPYVENLSLVPPSFRPLIQFCTAIDTSSRWTAPKAMLELYRLKSQLTTARGRACRLISNSPSSPVLIVSPVLNSSPVLEPLSALNMSSGSMQRVIEPALVSNSFFPVSPFAVADAMAALELALAPERLAVIEYYDDIAFAIQLFSEFASAEGSNYELSVPLAEGRDLLALVFASQPQPTSKLLLSSALAGVERFFDSDPDLQQAKNYVSSTSKSMILQLQPEMQRIETECRAATAHIAQNLRKDEEMTRSMTQSLIKQIRDEEKRALAANDIIRAKELQDRALNYQSQMEQQLLQMRADAHDATARCQQLMTDMQMKIDAVSVEARSRIENIETLCSNFRRNRALVQQALNRLPSWPRYGPLLRFDVLLQRYTTKLVFSKQWIPRFYVLRGSRLYYSDGKGGYPDSEQGTLAFMRSNPESDTRYCIELSGCSVTACSAPIDMQRFAFEIKFPVGYRAPKTMYLAAADDITRHYCIRAIQASSAGSVGVIPSAVALSSNLLAQGLPAVNTVLSVLGQDAVKALDASSLKAAGFPASSLTKVEGLDLKCIIAAGYDLASLKLAGFDVNSLMSLQPFSSAKPFLSYSDLKEAGFSLTDLVKSENARPRYSNVKHLYSQEELAFHFKACGTCNGTGQVRYVSKSWEVKVKDFWGNEETETRYEYSEKDCEKCLYQGYKLRKVDKDGAPESSFF